MNQNNLATKDEFKRGIKELKEEMVDMFDKLGVAVAKGFEETATKEELKAVENRLTNVENRLENVEEEVKDVKSQIVFRKDDVNNLKADTPSLSQFNNHEKRINKLENSVFAS